MKQWLARPGAALLAIALGMLLVAPSLGNGLNLDDVLQAARLAEAPGSWALFDLFGGPAPLVPAADLPWWRHDALQLALLRPLAALGHMFDSRLFAGQPIWMHLHSILWYGLLLVVAGRVYARFIATRWACTLALLLYAVDHSHGMVVGWLAARGAVIGAVGALLCLWAHQRWRGEGWRPGAWLAPLALLSALLANEGALGVCGYLAAYAIFLDRGRWPRRLATLVPAAVLVLVWRGCYVAAGFGTAHSGFYFDPGADPIGFLVRCLEHGVIHVASQILVPLGELLGMAPGMYAVGALVAAGLLLVLGLVLRGPLRRSPALRFWAVGALLCALPLGSTLPTDRQLLLVGFGVFGFAAQLWAEMVVLRPGARWFGIAWLVLHLGLSALLLPLRALGPAQVHAIAERATEAYVTTSPPRRVVLLRVPSDLLMLYGRMQWQQYGRPFPAELRYLYAGLGALEMIRVDARTLELRPALGWFPAPLDRLFRDERDGFTVGQRIDAGTMTAEIREVSAEGRPLVVRLQFEHSLEDPDFAWFSWEAGGPIRYLLPAIGETHRLPAMSNPLLSP